MEVLALTHQHTATGVAPYVAPAITDLGDLVEITAGCVGGVPEDSRTGGDTESFPADSGLFCE